MLKSLFSQDKILWNRWFENAERCPDRDAIVHWVAGEEPFRWSFSRLVEAAERLAAVLINHGLGKGDVCAVLMRHNKWFYPLYLAIECVGAIPAILAYPNPRLHPDKFRQGIEGMCQRSGLDWILTERDLEGAISPLVKTPTSTIKGLLFPLEWDQTARLEGIKLQQVIDIRRSATPSEPCLLQHSSGTTGLQKPVVLSHRAILQHVEYYGRAIGLNDEDKIVSWLPLYHDMGLIAAFHLPLAFGIPTVQIDTFEWVLVPSLLLEAVYKERGTISWLPNFAFSMLADKVREDEIENVNLESWRMIVNCSEPVRHESQQRFLRRFQAHGFKPGALSACYAMAETTFAVTQSPPGSPPAVLPVSRIALAKGSVEVAPGGPEARMCVSSGRSIPGCSVRIIDEEQQAIGDDRVGEIVIQSVSLFDGYRNYPEKTVEVLKDGWYYSGDYGFTHGGDLYVIGRKKDIIIVAGNNIYPEDVEDVVGKVDGILPGRVVAFAEEDAAAGSEKVAVIAECTPTATAEKACLKMEVIKAGMAIDVSIASVYLVPPRWLIKSSAGKPSRKANRERIIAENNQRIANDQ